MESDTGSGWQPLGDLKLCLAALTRLPVRLGAATAARPLAAAAWAFPLIGLGLGFIGGVVYFAAAIIGLTPWLGGCLAVAAMVLATGALHEDGLADVADGFGGGRDRTAKLAIMRDSHIGSYGVVALVLAFALRLGAIDEIGIPMHVLKVLMTAGAMSRAAVALVMVLGVPARSDGLAVAAGRVEVVKLIVAVAIALGAAALLLGMGTALVAGVAAAAAGLAILVLAKRQIGGITGDVLGATQVVAEIAVLLAGAIPTGPAI